MGSGKLDRKKLPIPGQEHRVKLSRALKKSTSKRKRSDLDRKVLKIWQKVLNREDISYEDNFFDVGGESLLAAKLIGHLEVELASDTRIHQDRLTVTVTVFTHKMRALQYRLRRSCCVTLSSASCRVVVLCLATLNEVTRHL